MLPPKYLAFTYMFLEEGPKTLASFNKYVYTIDLEAELALLLGPIYPLAKLELKVL